MYSTCLFCNRPLGSNEEVEAFPVGRRLAFDQRLGRLWVICRTCEKWNLTPLEERWDAIESCERMFRDARKRVSTDNIGLAQLSEGLELVRIGEPQRPEFAAWRYGDQFGRRHRKTVISAVAMTALAVGVLTVTAVGKEAGGLFVGLGAVGSMAQTGAVAARIWRLRRRQTRVRISTTERITFHGTDYLRLVQNAALPQGWCLELHCRGGRVVIDSDLAVHAVAMIMPRMNGEGGSKREVADAVNRLELSGGTGMLLKSIAADPQRQEPPRWRSKSPPGVHHLPAETRLAIEMAVNEENERRALEGELAILEMAWKDAEEIAAIADGLVLPRNVEADLSRLKAVSEKH